MALVQLNCHSQSLGMAITIQAIVPQQTGGAQIGMGGAEDRERYPVLYLLHGLSDDHTIWSRRTSLERYAADKNIVIVMPNVHRSYYTNMVHGLPYWDFISDELPLLASHFFPISTSRQDSFVAGLSMGGFGAFKLALNCPQRFAAAASLSGALDPCFMNRDFSEERGREWTDMFGSVEKWSKSENDLFNLLDKHGSAGTDLPKLWQHCGTEDFLYQDNIRFRDQARKNNIDLEYGEGPGGHSWDIWDQQIEKVLQWLPLKDKK